MLTHVGVPPAGVSAALDAWRRVAKAL
jgi:hypothetical protein